MHDVLVLPLCEVPGCSSGATDTRALLTSGFLAEETGGLRLSEQQMLE